MILRYGSKCIQLVSITHSFLLDVDLFRSLEMTKLSLTIITPSSLLLDKFTLYNSTKKIFGGPSLTPSPRLVSWHPRPDNVIKDNVGGNSGNPNRSEFGGLLRNFLDGWIIGFARSCGHTDNINMEPHAIYYVLLITWDLGFSDIICESDSNINFC